MKWKIRASKLSGSIPIPPSKSHTIRALLAATLAQGTSQLHNVLTTGDGASAIAGAKSMGAGVEIIGNKVTVRGIAGNYNAGSDHFPMENSGTSTNLFTSVAALGSRPRHFDGDASLRTRPFKPLLVALKNLGAGYSFENPKSDLPFIIAGPISGGRTTVEGVSSQFLSSLLFACPCAPKDTEIEVVHLQERPYVEMTLRWLDMLGIRYKKSDDMTRFIVFGNQTYKAIDYTVPGDFSSATFAAVAAPLTGSTLALQGLDFSDSQGDKGVFDIVTAMGASVQKGSPETIVNGTGRIDGQVMDLNAMPDSLPALSVLACVADGETHIVNVAQARIKETDRISVMTEELSKLGAKVVEQPDGLIISKSALVGAPVNGHGDHRVVMALALAGMVAEGETIIDTAEAAAVTYPTFMEDFKKCGANIEVVD